MNRFVASLALAPIVIAGSPAAAQDNTSWTFDVLEVVREHNDDVLVRLKPVPLAGNILDPATN